LNLLDLGFTLYALCHGATELNPLMRSLPTMLAWKVGMMWALCYVLELLAIKYQVARRGLKICTVIYAAVNVWHFVSILRVGR
jgi:hypothetical protein